MSIRSLTARLKDEAREARRREAAAALFHARADVEGETPREMGRRTSSDGEGAASHRGRAMLGIMVPSGDDHNDAVTAARLPLRGGIRPRKLHGRWNPPGGIAARFSLRPDNDYDFGGPEDPVDVDASREPASATGADASTEGRRVESPPPGDTTPITIELESHQESAD